MRTFDEGKNFRLFYRNGRYIIETEGKKITCDTLQEAAEEIEQIELQSFLAENGEK